MLKKFIRGGLPKVHIVIRGVIQKSTSVHKGGGGGQKWPKIGPHGLRMTPKTVLVPSQR